jgi:hypothetical protein
MLETIWLYLDRFTILIATCSALFAWRAWLRSTELLKANRIAAERKKAPITIRLVCHEFAGEVKSLELPYKPRRDQLSRQEILGIISLYYGEQRFSPAFMRACLENGDLSRVLEGSNDDSSHDELLIIEVDCKLFSQIVESVN